ncbi:restriction endonuclease subunit S [Streptomyces sp. NPDC005055]
MELPGGWVWATLGDVASWGSGGTPKSGVSQFYGGDIPWVVSGDLNDGPIHSATSNITAEGLKSSSAKWVPEGSVLIAMYGATIGKLAITGRPLTTNQAVAFATPHQEFIDKRFLFWYLRSQRDALRKTGKGGAQPNISQTILKAWPIPVPPIAEQLRIVEVIESHLSRLDASSHSLAHAQTLIPLQRRALHTAATEGRVVNSMGDVSDFVASRRESWGAVNGEKRYKDPVAADADHVPVVPQSWNVFSLEALTDPIRIIRYGILMPKVKSGGTVPYVEVKDLKGCSLHEKELHLTSTELDSQFAGARIESGDVLLAVRGSYDRSAVVSKDLNGANVSRDVARIAPLPGLDPEYLHLYLQSSFSQRYLKAHARGVAVKGVNIASIRALPVAVPSLATQMKIIEACQQQLSAIDAAEKVIALSSSRCMTLRKSLLTRAFSGKLIPQDPADEPASVLLDRIRADREVAGGKPKRTTRRPRKVATADAPPPPPASSTPAPTTSVQQELPL